MNNEPKELIDLPSKEEVEAILAHRFDLEIDSITSVSRVSVQFAYGLAVGMRIMRNRMTCTCGCLATMHHERTHEVERGSHYCSGCNSIHDLEQRTERSLGQSNANWNLSALQRRALPSSKND